MNLTYQPRRADINYCWKVSKFRYAVNKDLGWASPHENFSLINGFIGALGELAASNIFGIVWDGAMLKKDVYLDWRKKKADLGPFEIKTNSTPGGNLKIGPNDKDFANALLMYAPGSYDAGVELLKDKSPMIPPIKLLGYLKVAEAKKVGDWYPDKQNSKKGKWVIKRNLLKDPAELSKFIDNFNKMRLKGLEVQSGKVPLFRLKP